MDTLSNVNRNENHEFSNCISENTNICRQDSFDGVSTNYAHMLNCENELQNPEDIKQWYVMRTTYGREKKAYEFIITHGGTAFYPTITRKKYFDGSLVEVQESRLPNLFFVYGTEEEVKDFAFDNVNLPFLRFYYRHYHEGINIIKKPLTVPEKQMISLMIMCRAEDADTLLVPDSVTKFKEGQKVRVIEGQFKGVEGQVARWHGQQRVALIIEGLCTMATAYIPTSFLQLLENNG